MPDSAQLLLPRLNMAGLYYCAVVRDTRKKPMREEERFNFFPASPFCSVSWVFEGPCYHLGDVKGSANADGAMLLPELMFSGPHTRPGVSWSPGSLFAMTIGFYPESWQALTGRDLNGVVDRILPLQKAVSGELLGLFQAVFQGGSCHERLWRLEDALSPHWRQKRRVGGAAPCWFKDWVMALSSRAAMSGTGKSLRQVQRRVRSWTGQTQQALDVHARVESAFALSRLSQGKLDYARIAVEAGFADQSHMGREVRRRTGFSPAQINRLIDTDERFWLYRLLGERF
jgi:AraC-like DNA-binding protein